MYRDAAHAASAALHGRRVPFQLRTSPLLVPGLVTDNERVQFGDTTVGKGVNSVIVIHDIRARERVDGTCRHISTVYSTILGRKMRHTMHCTEIVFTEHADEQGVDVGMVDREPQAIRFDHNRQTRKSNPIHHQLCILQYLKFLSQ